MLEKLKIVDELDKFVQRHTPTPPPKSSQDKKSSLFGSTWKEPANTMARSETRDAIVFSLAVGVPEIDSVLLGAAWLVKVPLLIGLDC